ALILVHHTTVDYVVPYALQVRHHLLVHMDFFSIDEMLGNIFGTGATDIGLSQ
ncbi:hypothetical protein KI387_041716, partial [Taxus chinensis]